MFASTSWPSILGRFKSSRIRSGRGTSANSASRRRNCSALTPSLTTLRWLRTLFSANASLVMRTSPGSSSTSSTWIITPASSGAIGSALTRRGNRQRPPDRGTRSAGMIFVDPDLAAVEVDDLPAQRQPDAGARVGVARVQPLEDHEYAFAIGGIYPDPVVLAGELPHVAVALGRQPDNRGYVNSPELDRVGHQVR